MTTVPAVLRKKEKKILITLKAFEDEQSNYKAGCGQMWLTDVPGPVGVGKWVVHTNSLPWDVKNKSCETACHSITHVVKLGSRPATCDVVCRL